ncbi:hypothetical protein [Gelidibacter mesophilus]|uniref:hypothetical protein n=1 Tax=Gelidibacter mesophilus TaxID=169050 RepID=UPI0012F77898|nr:hypothetical protein [Gelidibacter mesophilus]
MRFHTSISEFRTRLSSSESQAKITKSDLDQFYIQLKTFDSRFKLFPKYYHNYIENLNRLRPDLDDTHPDWTFLKIALADKKSKPTKTLPIFVYHIKYVYKITSPLFIAHQKKQNLKKLNAPAKLEAKNNKPKSSKEWIRVPMPRNQPRK